MGQKIVWFCDLCSADDTEREGQPITLVLDGSTVEAELCAEHRQTITSAFELLAKVGRVSKAPKFDKDRKCPDCPKSYSSGSGLLDHRRKEHGYVSPRQKIDLTTVALKSGDPVTCPFKGCDEVKAWGPGMHAHLRTHVRAEEITPEEANDLYAGLTRGA